MTSALRSPKETDLLNRAKHALPGGTLGNVRMDEQYAFIVESGNGSRIRDISGNQYLDYLLGSGPMILGHAHPKVIDAASNAMAKGTTFFAQNEYAIELAERIIHAMPCAEQVRFISSGTEATYNALKIARAFRKRDKILKFEGGYHGMHDYSQMSLSPAEPPPFPQPQPSSAGIPQAIRETVLIAPFNNLNAVETLLDQRHNELAAVIVEPVQRIIEPQPGFLQGLRELTQRYGVLLIFDEVVTGFRLAYGGAQEYYRVTPDLAAFGKIAGGGFPLAGVAGPRHLMELLDSAAAPPDSYVPQIGTLSGNPVAAAAGIATLDILKQPGVYDAYHARANRLRSALQRLCIEAEIPAVVSGVDVMFDIYFTNNPITDYRSTLVDKTLNRLFDNALLQHGVFKSAGKFYVGVCHTDHDIDLTIQAFQTAIATILDA